MVKIKGIYFFEDTINNSIKVEEPNVLGTFEITHLSEEEQVDILIDEYLNNKE